MASPDGAVGPTRIAGRPLRVLHLIPSLDYGGSERQVALLAREQAFVGFDVHLGLLRLGPQANLLDASKVRLHELRHGSNHDPGLALNVLRLVRTVAPDVVQTWLTQMDILGGIAARLSRRRWVMTERSSAGAYPPTIKHWLRLRLGRAADRIVANSAAGVDYWHCHGVSGHCCVVPNAVQPDESGSQHFRGRHTAPVILFVGRFVPEKNLHLLIEALGPVLRERPAQAMFCGDGPQRDRLRAQIEAAGLAERVSLPGYCMDVPALIRSASVFVSLSAFEGQPNTVLEAMAGGCPVVLSDIPAHRELVDNESALLVNPADVRSVTQAILQTLTDPAASHKRADRARDRVRVQTPSAIARQYESVYRDVLNGNAYREIVRMPTRSARARSGA